MRGQLCFLDIEFVHPPGISGTPGWDMSAETLPSFFPGWYKGFGSPQPPLKHAASLVSWLSIHVSLIHPPSQHPRECSLS